MSKSQDKGGREARKPKADKKKDKTPTYMSGSAPIKAPPPKAAPKKG